jgi:DsbC/DsbD-like thiol-disulfide interchange protein
MRRLLPMLVLLAVFWDSHCMAESIQARHARVELVSAQSNITPGHQLWLGLHFALEKNWHIYWTNPGDSGQPPVLQWQLPSGLTAGTIQWPLPEKLTRSTLADYGYQDDVVLLVPVQSGSGLQAGEKAEIGLTAKWLICADVCIPDHAQLHLSLPVSSTAVADPAQAPLFSNSRKQLPKRWPHGWRASAVSGKDSFVLSITAGKLISAAEFFPLIPDQIDNAAPQPLQRGRQGVKLTLKKSEQLLQPVRVLKGLLVLDNGESYVMDVPVTPAPSQAHND